MLAFHRDCRTYHPFHRVAQENLYLLVVSHSPFSQAQDQLIKKREGRKRSNRRSDRNSEPGTAIAIFPSPPVIRRFFPSTSPPNSSSPPPKPQHFVSLFSQLFSTSQLQAWKTHHLPSGGSRLYHSPLDLDYPPPRPPSNYDPIWPIPNQVSPEKMDSDPSALSRPQNRSTPANKH